MSTGGYQIIPGHFGTPRGGISYQHLDKEHGFLSEPPFSVQLNHEQSNDLFFRDPGPHPTYHLLTKKGDYLQVDGNRVTAATWPLAVQAAVAHGCVFIMCRKERIVMFACPLRENVYWRRAIVFPHRNVERKYK